MWSSFPKGGDRTISTRVGQPERHLVGDPSRSVFYGKRVKKHPGRPPAFPAVRCIRPLHTERSAAPVLRPCLRRTTAAGGRHRNPLGKSRRFSPQSSRMEFLSPTGPGRAEFGAHRAKRSPSAAQRHFGAFPTHPPGNGRSPGRGWKTEVKSSGVFIGRSFEKWLDSRRSAPDIAINGLILSAGPNHKG